MQLLLWALQSPINIGMILRSAEIYRVPVAIYDGNGVFARPEALRTITDFACGAMQRQPPTLLRDPAELRPGQGGRRVATAITPDAETLPAFAFRSGDVVLVGNEYDGLPPELLRGADARVNIPMPPGYLPKPPSWSPIDPARAQAVRSDGQPNLNVAVAASIILYHAYVQSR